MWTEECRSESNFLRRLTAFKTNSKVLSYVVAVVLFWEIFMRNLQASHLIPICRTLLFTQASTRTGCGYKCLFVMSSDVFIWHKRLSWCSFLLLSSTQMDSSSLFGVFALCSIWLTHPFVSLFICLWLFVFQGGPVCICFSIKNSINKHLFNGCDKIVCKNFYKFILNACQYEFKINMQCILANV